jgi:predicted ATPase/class 3 adenylate cyclase
MSLAAYVPIDRYHALAYGANLAEHTDGAALFADISGFTPLTEALALELGQRRGGEELTHHLNTVYDALILQVHNYRGSVLSFSGDAITCWFDGADGLLLAIQRATTAALEMQQAMQKMAQITTPQGQVLTLALKVAIAAGPVRRFVVGNPRFQYLDILAGTTIDRMAATEHLANKGEVLVAPEVHSALSDYLEIAEWRGEDSAEAQAAVVVGLKEKAALCPWPEVPEEALPSQSLAPWLLPSIYERNMAGLGDFLTELRPAVSLFLRFGGLDYDDDEEAGRKLDRYIRWVQEILVRYESNLLQVTIGDKGSYLYAAFGAPVAHHNDTERAVRAALALLSPPSELAWVEGMQIGISQGVLRTGAYGGSTSRHTYGVLGDEVNLSARLMQAAQPGQILVSGRVQYNTTNLFNWEKLPSIKVKGKAEPITVFGLYPHSEKHSRSLQLPEPFYKLPMVGRESELGQARAALEKTLTGQGQIVSVIAEAGMGKSRFLAEVTRMALEVPGLKGFGGECQSFGTNIPYLVWQPIFREFFQLDPIWSVDQQIWQIEKQLAAIDPLLVRRLPLLGPVLNLTMPDNDLTGSFDEKLKKESREALLVDCLKARLEHRDWRAPGEPEYHPALLLVLEDCHWIDPLSHDLLEAVGQAISNLPVLILLAYRPPELERLQSPRVEQLAYNTIIKLQVLTFQQAEKLIGLKLAQYREQEEPSGAVPTDLIQRMTIRETVKPGQLEQLPSWLAGKLMERAEGNPFYLEELLNYLQDQKLNWEDDTALTTLELPDSLHSLVLSRLDQLGESEKVILKVASVIGRVFKADWVYKVYPAVGLPEHVKRLLERLDKLDITPLDKPEPELEYLFKHAIMREVTYESLPFATRRTLHWQLGDFIEKSYAELLEHYIDLLAYHYGFSDDEAKKREYWYKAGEAAQAAYANSAALDYYRRLLPLLAEPEQPPVMLRLGQVLELVGNWDEASQLYEKGLELAEQLGDKLARGRFQHALGRMLQKRGQADEALFWLEGARHDYEALADASGISQVLMATAEAYRQNGEYALAKLYYEESMFHAEAVEIDRARLSAQANAYKGLGALAIHQGDYATARARCKDSLTILRRLGDKPVMANVLSNMGVIGRLEGDYDEARQLHEEALAVRREMGDRWGIAVSLGNLGMVARNQGDYSRATALYQECLALYRQLGARNFAALALNNLGDVMVDQGDYRGAEAVYKESLAIQQSLGDRWALAYLMEAFAGLAALQSRPERALRLAGAAANLRKVIGAPLSPAEQTKFDRLLEPARRLSGEAQAEAFYAAGQQLNLDQAIALALA